MDNPKNELNTYKNIFASTLINNSNKYLKISYNSKKNT